MGKRTTGGDQKLGDLLEIDFDNMIASVFYYRSVDGLQINQISFTCSHVHFSCCHVVQLKGSIDL